MKNSNGFQLSELQVEKLEEFYRDVCKYVDKQQSDDLSQTLQMDRCNIQKWFTTRRYRDKKNGNSSDSLQVKVVLSPDQNRALEEFFAVNKYPKAQELFDLSDSLEVDKGKINIWFKNKRAREKKREAVEKLDESDEEKLEESYLKNSYPKRDEFAEISRRVGLSEVKTRKWFRDRRTLARKEANVKVQASLEAFGEELVKALEDFYAFNKHPKLRDMNGLSREFNVERSAIKAWLERRRFKDEEIDNKSHTDSDEPSGRAAGTKEEMHDGFSFSQPQLVLSQRVGIEKVSFDNCLETMQEKDEEPEDRSESDSNQQDLTGSSSRNQFEVDAGTIDTTERTEENADNLSSETPERNKEVDIEEESASPATPMCRQSQEVNTSLVDGEI